MKRAYADTPEGQIHYRYAGKGTPIVMVHMAGSHSGEWEKVSDILVSRGYACYALDLPGYGMSYRPERHTIEDHYSMDDFADSVIAFMDAVGLKKAYFIGNLAGSNICTLIAIRNPERVIGLQCSDFCYYGGIDNYKERKYIPMFAPVGPMEGGEHLREFWKRTDIFGEAPLDNDFRTVGMVMAGCCGESMHWALYEEDLYTERFKNIRCKAVFLATEKMGRIEMAKEVASLVPGASFDVQKGSSPYVCQTAPEKIADMFIKYFSR